MAIQLRKKKNLKINAPESHRANNPPTKKPIKKRLKLKKIPKN